MKTNFKTPRTREDEDDIYVRFGEPRLKDLVNTEIEKETDYSTYLAAGIVIILFIIGIFV